MAHEAGKGSGRRKEDVSKVKSNWDLIDWSNKAQAVKGNTTMNDEHEHIEDDEDDEICHWCNGSGEGMYDGSRCGHCKGTGVEPVEQEFDDGFLD